MYKSNYFSIIPHDFCTRKATNCNSVIFLHLASNPLDFGRTITSPLQLTFTRCCCILMLFLTICRCSLVVELQLPKLVVWVRFPSSAPKNPARRKALRGFVCLRCCFTHLWKRGSICSLRQMHPYHADTEEILFLADNKFNTRLFQII